MKIKEPSADRISAEKRCRASYQKENQHQVKLKINKVTEPELLEWVTSRSNIQGYIKDLIRRDMRESGALYAAAGQLLKGGTADD